MIIETYHNNWYYMRCLRRRSLDSLGDYPLVPVSSDKTEERGDRPHARDLQIIAFYNHLGAMVQLSLPVRWEVSRCVRVGLI
jgi:hypothetical protein